jgi:hypothetical protein
MSWTRIEDLRNEPKTILESTATLIEDLKSGQTGFVVASLLWSTKSDEN